MNMKMANFVHRCIFIFDLCSVNIYFFVYQYTSICIYSVLFNIFSDNFIKRLFMFRIISMNVQYSSALHTYIPILHTTVTIGTALNFTWSCTASCTAPSDLNSLISQQL